MAGIQNFFRAAMVLDSVETLSDDGGGGSSGVVQPTTKAKAKAKPKGTPKPKGTAEPVPPKVASPKQTPMKSDSKGLKRPAAATDVKKRPASHLDTEKKDDSTKKVKVSKCFYQREPMDSKLMEGRCSLCPDCI